MTKTPLSLPPAPPPYQRFVRRSPRRALVWAVAGLALAFAARQAYAYHQQHAMQPLVDHLNAVITDVQRGQLPTGNGEPYAVVDLRSVQLIYPSLTVAECERLATADLHGLPRRINDPGPTAGMVVGQCAAPRNRLVIDVPFPLTGAELAEIR